MSVKTRGWHTAHGNSVRNRDISFHDSVQWYTILNKQNNNAISVKGSVTKAGTPVELDSPTGNLNQQWFQQS